MKIIKLEEMIRGFLGESARLQGKELGSMEGEILELREDVVVLENPVGEVKSNVFTRALFYVARRIYEVIHEFVNFNVDFESHRVFLGVMEEEMKREWKEINT